MASSSDPSKGKQGAAPDRSARAQMEEAMGRLDLTEEEASPLVVDDLEEGPQQKWAIAGKILHRKAWLCVGGFNETAYGTEHFSRAARPEWQMRAFREVLEDCSLQDLGFSGVPFTWDNRQAGGANVKARLDRAVANAEFLQRNENSRRELGSWGAREFGCLAKTVRKLQKKLEILRKQSVGRGPTEEEKVTVVKLREALRQEEVWMRQRSRVPWLRQGDRNTKYYQAQAAQRKRMNRISNLQRADGTMCATEEEDKTEIQSFYQALFTTQGFHEMDELLQYVPERVSMEMNTSLDKPFEADEVKTTLFQMSPSKAPGVDGFTVGFFPEALGSY
ncbi:uncharacterized protein [Aegilops tauschii subsp. strangulata]|uniref:uncharacterized protein n=1 Tax=Aegilops tauschii subsp. strangulata TaxID=200361 RepID=UPI003CC8DF5A